MPKRHHHVLLAMTFALVAAHMQAHATHAAVATVLRIDGKSLAGQWIGVQPDGTGITLEVDSQTHTLLLADVLSITCDVTASPSPAPALFYTIDGGRFGGRIEAAEPEALRVQTRARGRVVIPFTHLAAIQLAQADDFPDAHAALLQSLQDRHWAKDTLITRTDAKRVHGTLASLGPDEGTFHFGNKLRTFSCTKMFAVILATGTTSRPPPPLRVTTRTGDILTGHAIPSGESTSLGVRTSLGPDVTLAIAKIVRVECHSHAFVYLSDLHPTDTRYCGRLHRTPAMRNDTNVTGGPIRLGGTTYRKGLGCQSKTEIDYTLDEPFHTFAATVGIDDSMQARGGVIFRVLGDGQPLAETKVLTGADTPLAITVPIAGVNVLTLITDFGDDLDLSDHANWAGARVIRPAPARSTGARP